MRIWDLAPELLCRQHLLGEHRELHGLWNILTQDKKGYRNHPETQRWVGKLHRLALRHEMLVHEMTARGWNHKSPLVDVPDYEYEVCTPVFVHSPEQQIEILRAKGCSCRV